MGVLKDSLWKRTLAHISENDRNLEAALLKSRAAWLWQNTTVNQRQACFYSSLGRKPGLFIHERLDSLVDTLAGLQAAVVARDAEGVAEAAVQFAQVVMTEPFFSLRKLPDNWEDVLADWVRGVAFFEILNGRNARDVQRTQAFIQDGVVFRLVWAAEAARVQAIASDHFRQGDLGDGPALVFTYGVPTIPAALLCQIGFASRVGALWVTEQHAASFTDADGLRDWLRQNDAFLDDPDVWEVEDHYLMWTHAAMAAGAEYPRLWERTIHKVTVTWSRPVPEEGALTRIIAGSGRAATICGADLSTLGTAQLPFDPHGAALNGRVAAGGRVEIEYFGRS